MGDEAELRRRVAETVTRTLAESWHEGTRDGVAYAYHQPSPTTYPWQWYWDSCLIAIAARHVEPERARQELETLLAAQDKTGFIGHTVFWGSRVSLPRLPFYNVRHRADLMTSTIQPPLLAYAWSIVVGDPSKDPRIVRHHAEIERRRDLEGDGLLWIIQPDESGLDASPQFDPVWGRRAHGRPGFRRLVVANRRLNFDARAIAGAGGPVVCEPLTNTLHGLSRLALGQPSITPALVQRLWDPTTALFRLEQRPGGRVEAVDTIAGLAPLALPDLPPEIGHAMVRRHLLDEHRFQTAVGPPSVSLSDPHFSLQDRRMGLRRYWRGPTWVNTAWLVWMGLNRLGYREEASRMAHAIAETVVREGLREYYDPASGKGMGAQGFGWSALALDMLSPSADVQRSYIPPARIPPVRAAPPAGRQAPPEATSLS